MFFNSHPIEYAVFLVWLFFVTQGCCAAPTTRTPTDDHHHGLNINNTTCGDAAFCTECRHGVQLQVHEMLYGLGKKKRATRRRPVAASSSTWCHNWCLMTRIDLVRFTTTTDQRGKIGMNWCRNIRCIEKSTPMKTWDEIPIPNQLAETRRLHPTEMLVSEDVAEKKKNREKWTFIKFLLTLKTLAFRSLMKKEDKTV